MFNDVIDGKISTYDGLIRARQQLGNTIGHLRRKCSEYGTVNLFFIEGSYYYVTEYPPTCNNKYILPKEYVKKFEGGKKLIPSGGTLKCFKDVYEKYPECYIGCYNESLTTSDVKEDIEEYFNPTSEG